MQEYRIDNPAVTMCLWDSGHADMEVLAQDGDMEFHILLGSPEGMRNIALHLMDAADHLERIQQGESFEEVVARFGGTIVESDEITVDKFLDPGD